MHPCCLFACCWGVQPQQLSGARALPLLLRAQAADEDGSGELDIDEFCAKLGPHLGANLTPQQARPPAAAARPPPRRAERPDRPTPTHHQTPQVRQLFNKIDADAGGTVDWDEFTNFMLLERAAAAGGDADADNWRLFPSALRDKTPPSAAHHEQVRSSGRRSSLSAARGPQSGGPDGDRPRVKRNPSGRPRLPLRAAGQGHHVRPRRQLAPVGRVRPGARAHAGARLVVADRRGVPAGVAQAGADDDGPRGHVLRHRAASAARSSPAA